MLPWAQCSWASKFFLVRGDVISWVTYAMSPEKITLTGVFTLSVLCFIRKVWKLQNRVIFLANTSMRPVIAG